MNQPLDQFAHTASDWRGQIKKNTRRTYTVIALFFLIYISIGLLVDAYIYSGQYLQTPISEIFYALLTFQLFPLVTFILFAVAAISLMVTYSMYDKLMLLGTEYHEVTPESKNLEERQLYNVIEELKIAAGLRYMPKVFIIEAEYMNAFASGYSEKSAMMAITRGLMQKLNRSELQAVMAHEMSHIRHMDIKLTLTASLLANLTLMVLDLFFYQAVFANRNASDNRSRNGLAAIIMILRYLMPVISVLLLLYLSRTREYMADAGCVELTRDNQPLASALLKISNDHTDNQEKYTADYQRTPHENVRREAYIFDPAEAGITAMDSIADLFSTHPNIRARLAALGFKQYDKK